MEMSSTTVYQSMNGQSENVDNLERQEIADESAESASIDGSTGQPEAKYKVLDKVYGRDTDGLLYPAVIRRALYGPIYHQQVQVGMSDATEEASNLPDSGKTNTECWQYFVHFLMWNVSWDRWLPEDKILPMSEEITKYAETLAAEHKALRAALTRKTPGKKAFQNLNTAAFLPEWRKTLDRIDRQFKGNDIPSSVSPPEEMSSKPTRTAKWSKSAIQAEVALRGKGLISKKFHPATNTIFLPFTLKKVLVESWEIINQCGMVAKLPADVSVREALAQYLQSKGICPPSNSAKKVGVNEPKLLAEDVKNDTNQTPKTDPSLSSSLDIAAVESQLAPLQDEQKAIEETTAVSSSKDDSMQADGEADMKKLLDEEWVKLSEGIIQLFDEALPKRLLYRDELFQLQVIESQEGNSQHSYSDIYGCEHLLRLLVSLPSLITEMMTEDESRPIIAKINDFVRYMYKNQTVLFQQTYRKLSDLEQQVRDKELTRRAQKRKRIEERKQTS